MRNANSNRAAGDETSGGQPNGSDRAALSSDQRARQSWMGVLSMAPAVRLFELFDSVADKPGFSMLRKAESGLIMTQGRIGGAGQSFNMGEMTVTRCTVQLSDGTVGHAYQAGRNKKKAQCSAILDAMLQQPDRQADIMKTIIDPLKAEQDARDLARSKKVAATKVDFFTLVRGED